MRPIHAARLDKVRPVLVLTREEVRPHRTRVTVAPISSTVRGLSVELHVGLDEGLDRESVANLDEVMTIREEDLGPQIGELPQVKEPSLAAAVFHAFALSW